MDIGIDAAHREKIAGGLSKVLGDTFTLYLKTHYFHWNVTGARCQTLPNTFRHQYNDQWLDTDSVAELIRALDFPAQGTYKQFTALSSIKEDDGVPKATDMIKRLVEGHEGVARTARAVFTTAEEA